MILVVGGEGWISHPGHHLLWRKELLLISILIPVVRLHAHTLAEMK
jgi:hypothetical protein